ncbi:hypothetical protein Tco_0381773 [Tanacetum coccineum]
MSVGIRLFRPQFVENTTNAVQKGVQLATDPECDELLSSTGLNVLGNLVVKPFGKLIIKLMCAYGKNKMDYLLANILKNQNLHHLKKIDFARLDKSSDFRCPTQIQVSFILSDGTCEMKTAFHNGFHDGEVYVAQPDGFVIRSSRKKSTYTGKLLDLKMSLMGEDEILLGLQINQVPKKDADHAGRLGYSEKHFWRDQFLGINLSAGCSIEQICTAMSSAEAEYVALSACFCAVLSSIG